MPPPAPCPHCGTAIEPVDGVCPACGHEASQPAPGISAGMTLGDFRIERRVGGGGMGEVFLATQLSLDRKVAVKVLPPAITRDPELVSDFKHEMRALAKLDHPNVATAFAAGEHDGLHFMAMAFVDGEDLAERLLREGPLPEREALDCTLKVAEALKYGWDRFHLLHRDIKPGNIMIDREGVVKLMDMGLSKTLYEDLGGALSSTIMGTPNYMSPEQARGEPGLSVSVDIYALGTTLYHLLSGLLPFDAETPETVLEAVLSEELQPVKEIRPELSDATARLIERMTARDPAQRYPDWASVIEDARKAWSGEDEATDRGARRVRVDPGELAAKQERGDARRRRDRRRARAVGAVITILALAGAGGGIAYLYRAGRQADDARERAQTAEDEQHSAEQRADALEAEARAKVVEATVARALINTNFGEALADLLAVREGEEDPDLVRQLTEATWQVESRKREAIDHVLNTLQAEAEARGPAEGYARAADVFLVYQGPYAVETRAERRQRAARMIEEGEQRAEDLHQRSEARYAEVQEEVIGALLDGEDGEAAISLHLLLDEDLLPDVKLRGEELLAMVEDIQRMPALVLGAYRKYLGRETTVYFRDGKLRVEIVEVADDQVRAVYHGPGGEEPHTFGIDDLGLREKVVRLGRRRRADLDVIRGLLAYQGGREESARRYLKLAEHDLAALLLIGIADRESDEEPAREDEGISS